MQHFTQGGTLPGMDFFQSMLKGAGMPGGFASWMAPTLDPDELEQKITDLKAVLQWLEANCRLTQATIQGLEVQRMTLSALKTMNVDMEGLATRMGDAMQASARAMAEQAGAAAAHSAEPSAAQQQWAAESPAEAAVEDAEQAAEQLAADAQASEGDAGASATSGMMDPMQWWNAVSQQFSQVASQALRDNPWPMPTAAGDAPEGVRADAAKSRRTKPAAPSASPSAKSSAAKRATASAATSGGKPRAQSAPRKKSAGASAASRRRGPAKPD